MKEIDERKQIKFGSVLSYSQMIISVVIGLVYTPIMIRMLGKSEYGLYNIVSSTIAMLSILNLGFNAGYVKYYSKYKADGDKRSIDKLNGLFLLIFTAIGLVALFCGLFLSFNLDLVFDEGLTAEEYGIAKILMLLLTANLAVSFPMSVFSNIISANEKFIFLKAIGIIKTVLNPMLALPLLLLGFRSIALVTITLIINVLVDTVYLIYVLAVLKNKFVFRGFERGLLKNLASYTAFIAIHLIVDQINWNVAKILIGRFRGTGDVAIYSVGFSLYTHYISIGRPIVSLFVPRVHRIVTEEREAGAMREKLTDIMTRIGSIQYVILAAVATGMIFFGRSFIAFWAGEGYESSYYVALLLIIPGTVDLIQNVAIEIQRAQNKHRFRALVYIAMAVINIAISIVLCQRYGAVGAAVGTAISLVLVQGVIINIYLHKKCNVNVFKFWRKIGRLSIGLIIPVIAGVLLSRFIVTDTLVKLAAVIAVYGMVYCISMFFFGFGKEERGMIKHLLHRG